MQRKTFFFFRFFFGRNRLLLQHYVIRYAFGSNIIPPIDTTIAGKVLDCGCGPGTWVMVSLLFRSIANDIMLYLFHFILVAPIPSLAPPFLPFL